MPIEPDDVFLARMIHQLLGNMDADHQIIRGADAARMAQIFKALGLPDGLATLEAIRSRQPKGKR